MVFLTNESLMQLALRANRPQFAFIPIVSPFAYRQSKQYYNTFNSKTIHFFHQIHKSCLSVITHHILLSYYINLYSNLTLIIRFTDNLVTPLSAFLKLFH